MATGALGCVVRRHEHARMRPKRARVRQRLGFEHVERGGVELARLQGRQDVGVALQAAAAGID